MKVCWIDSRLGIAVGKVVIVIVELRRRICLGGKPEGDGEVGLSHDFEEDIIAVTPVLIES